MRTAIMVAFLFWAAALARHAHGGTVGPLSDFQDGTTQGWTSGFLNPRPPIVRSGSHGPGNDALEVFGSGLARSGGRIVTFNQFEWTGNYLSAGVSAISMDLHNIGSTELDIRLAIDGAGGRFSTLGSATLQPASGWTNVVFPVAAADWTSAGGVNVNATLGSVFQLRILNNPFPSFMGAIEGGTLLIDNIAVVPEPVSLTLFAVMGLAIARRKRRGTR